MSFGPGINNWWQFVFQPLVFALCSRMEMFWESHWGELSGKIFPVFELTDHGSHLEVGDLSDTSGKLPGLQEQWVVIPFWWFVSRELQILLGMGTRWTSLCLLSIFCSSKTDLAYFHSVLCLSRCQVVLVRSQMAPTLHPFLGCHCSPSHRLPLVRFSGIIQLTQVCP